MKWLIRGVALLVFLLLGLFALVMWFEQATQRTFVRSLLNELELVRDAAESVCIERDALISAAEAQGFEHEDIEDGLRIHVQPIRPFQKISGRFFGFDDAGCLTNDDRLF